MCFSVSEASPKTGQDVQVVGIPQLHCNGDSESVIVFAFLVNVPIALLLATFLQDNQAAQEQYST